VNGTGSAYLPKKFKAPLTEVLREANELKVIIYNKDDFNWAEEHAAQVSLPNADYTSSPNGAKPMR
jgi:hypothetical protein